MSLVLNIHLLLLISPILWTSSSNAKVNPVYFTRHFSFWAPTICNMLQFAPFHYHCLKTYPHITHFHEALILLSFFPINVSFAYGSYTMYRWSFTNESMVLTSSLPWFWALTGSLFCHFASTILSVQLGPSPNPCTLCWIQIRVTISLDASTLLALFHLYVYIYDSPFFQRDFPQKDSNSRRVLNYPSGTHSLPTKSNDYQLSNDQPLLMYFTHGLPHDTFIMSHAFLPSKQSHRHSYRLHIQTISEYRASSVHPLHRPFAMLSDPLVKLLCIVITFSNKSINNLLLW